MKHYIIILSIFLSLITEITGKQKKQDSYEISLPKSSLVWNAKKVTGEHFGNVKLSFGQIVFKNNKLDRGKFIIDMTSIENTDIESEKWNLKLVKHLKSSDFFSTDSFPEAEFKLIQAKINREQDIQYNNYEIAGILTIKDISHEIQFSAQIKPHNTGFIANGEIILDRTLWDIRYRSGKFFKNLEEKLIYDKFSITFSLETE